MQKIDFSQLINSKKTEETVNDHLRSPFRYGLIIILIFFVGFIGWMAYAPLNSAVIAIGKIEAKGKNAHVQHLEGGIVSKIYVIEGTHVKKGQILAEIRNNKTLSQLKRFILEKNIIQLNISRIVAEIAEKNHLEYALSNLTDLEAKARSEIQIIIDTEQQFLNENIALLKSERALYATQIREKRVEMQTLQQSIKSAKIQEKLLLQQFNDYKNLVNKKLLPYSQLRQSEINLAEYNSRNVEMLGRLNIIKEQLIRMQQERHRVERKRRVELTASLRKSKKELASIEKELTSIKDTVDRMDLRAPIDGYIINSQLKNVGDTIRGTEIIMEIVPSEEQFLIRARITPNDIDQVHTGLKTEIILSAFSRRFTQKLEGEVISISADRKVDRNTGENYFEVDVKLPDLHMQRNANDKKDIFILPGMPVEVVILTEEKTVLEYILDPLLKSLQQGLRET